MNNDLISREALKEKLNKTEGIEYDSRAVVEEVIDNAPTVAVNCKDCDGYEAGYSAGLKDAERPQGDFIKMSDRFGVYFACNKCGYDRANHKSNFCPNCGADMRGTK